ncbi:MAG: hypothetical protein FWE01_01005 [Firmicutes bacterium]|nr:hypothetical protein [Bacillota bacterium]
MKKFYLGIFLFMFVFSVAIVFVAVPFVVAANLPSEVRLTNEEFAQVQPIQLQGSRFVKQSTNKQSTVGDEDARFVELKLFGLIPIKTVKVDILPFDTVIPGGRLIGLKAKIDGVLVTDDNKELRLKKGDIIKRAGGEYINSIAELNKIFEQNDSFISLEGARGNSTFKAEIDMQRLGSLGLVLKDETSGIGTLTYVNPENNNFASLGHRMNDFETSTHVDLRGGSVHDISIIGTERSQGKRVGSYRSNLNNQKLGDILTSNNFGVFGCLADIYDGKPLPVASRYNIKPGKAKILSTSVSGEIKEYDIEIIKTRYQKKPSTKSMILRITDKELLADTGGIIHGMSGSPIIQKGKVVGALTHVILGDLTKGYGLYIDFIMP